MVLNTASQVISFARKLEEDGAALYEKLAQTYSDVGETFLYFAKENRKNITQIQQVYYGVITDAIEGCFTFSLNPEEYAFELELSENQTYPDVINKYIEVEEKTLRFYLDAAEQSQTLLADIPRAFRLVAKKREERKLRLKMLLSNES